MQNANAHKFFFLLSAGPGDSETAPYEGDPNGVRGQLAGNSGSHAARAGGHPPRRAAAPQEKGRRVAKDTVFFLYFFYIFLFFIFFMRPGVTHRAATLRLKKKDEEWRKTRYFFHIFFIFFLYLKKGRVAQDAVFRY